MKEYKVNIFNMHVPVEDTPSTELELDYARLEEIRESLDRIDRFEHDVSFKDIMRSC